MAVAQNPLTQMTPTQDNKVAGKQGGKKYAGFGAPNLPVGIWRGNDVSGGNAPNAPTVNPNVPNWVPK